MILSSVKCVAPDCDWVIVYCTLSTPEISAQLGPLPISTTCAGALSDSGKMSKQRTLLNVFKPSSSSSSQENDSEGTTAASEGTSGDAETIYNKLVEICDDLGLDPRRIIGLGSDGASVMLGKKTGVGVRLKVRSPHLTHVHCVAHRVNLAASGAAKLENVDDYRKTVNAVFKVFKYSAARYQRLRELHAAMEPDHLQSLKEPCAVRWLSFTKAAKSIDANWPQLVLSLDEEAARNNPVAAGLLRKLKTFSFAAMTNTLLDVLIWIWLFSEMTWISQPFVP